MLAALSSCKRPLTRMTAVPRKGAPSNTLLRMASGTNRRQGIQAVANANILDRPRSSLVFHVGAHEGGEPDCSDDQWLHDPFAATVQCFACDTHRFHARSTCRFGRPRCSKRFSVAGLARLLTCNPSAIEFPRFIPTSVA